MQKLTTAYLRQYLPSLTDAQLRDDLLAHGTLRRIPSGQTILTERQFVEYIPLVTKGGVKVLRTVEEEKNIFLYFIRPGETCTMTLSSCLNRQVSQVRAITIVESELILLPVERVYFYAKQYSSWHEFTLQSFRDKFDDILEAFERLAFDSLEKRIEKYLTELSTIKEASQINITHAELAIDLGTSRVVVSRALKGLEQLGRLKLGRNEIFLNNSLK